MGYSDHSAKIETGIAAVSLGAEILEFHVKLNNQEIGPDASSSLTIEEASILVKSLGKIIKATYPPVDKNDNSQYLELKTSLKNHWQSIKI